MVFRCLMENVTRPRFVLLFPSHLASTVAAALCFEAERMSGTCNWLKLSSFGQVLREPALSPCMVVVVVAQSSLP